ncbi:MAG: hypothetical protein JSR24_01920 [Proteobacteria bacterium]|nr:hypothetical protein [Pseudomonadota bacterium]
MLTVLVDKAQGAVLVKFSATLAAADLAVLDRALAPYAASSFTNVIVDFSAVTESTLTPEHLRARARREPVLKGRTKIFVAAGALAFGLARQFTAQRALSSAEAADIVPTLDAACAQLGLAAPAFVPL